MADEPYFTKGGYVYQTNPISAAFNEMRRGRSVDPSQELLVQDIPLTTNDHPVTIEEVSTLLYDPNPQVSEYVPCSLEVRGYDVVYDIFRSMEAHHTPKDLIIMTDEHHDLADPLGFANPWESHLVTAFEKQHIDFARYIIQNLSSRASPFVAKDHGTVFGIIDSFGGEPITVAHAVVSTDREDIDSSLKLLDLVKVRNLHVSYHFDLQPATERTTHLKRMCDSLAAHSFDTLERVTWRVYEHTESEEVDLICHFIERLGLSDLTHTLNLDVCISSGPHTVNSATRLLEVVEANSSYFNGVEVTFTGFTRQFLDTYVRVVKKLIPKYALASSIPLGVVENARNVLEVVENDSSVMVNAIVHQGIFSVDCNSRSQILFIKKGLSRKCVEIGVDALLRV